MAAFANRVTLGRSGLSVGPLGVSGGYGVGAASLLKAFDRGTNYFYHGSRRRHGMTAAIRNLVAAGRRELPANRVHPLGNLPELIEKRLQALRAQAHFLDEPNRLDAAIQ